MRMAIITAALLIAGQANAQPAEQPVFSFQSGRPTLNLADGNLTVRPVLRLDLDGGSFWGQAEPGGFGSGVNVRRGRLGLQGTFLRDFSYNFTWDFAPSSPQGQSNGGSIFELQAAYEGLKWATFRVGAFTLLHTLEFSGSSFETLFMERASIVTLATSMASGTTRLAAGVEARGERWFASFYLSDGVLSTLHDDRQGGVVGRAAWLALDDTVKLQVGLSGVYQFRPGPNSLESVRLRDYPELRLDPQRFVDTGSIPASAGWSIGPEVSGMVGPLHFAAEYYHVGVDARSGGDRGFDGWYAALAYPLLGEPRRRDAKRGAWAKGRAEDLNPAAGTWGALELAGRYSAIDLNDGLTRGGRQGIWTAALNWYPTSRLRLTAQYMNGRIALDGPDRDFQAVGMRLAFNL
ncbi:OprO/OprP family phosphate-selective porin [Siccirubricoccus sp. G192]|uniref:OprO/OprP family phosphate-selective porin n=1 Tax=Siccirubricoccus sp. G192 TaxID=2849651 RepID=UPI001C2BB4A5|nr:porin [Siccirubricoccus sp. G192]MBV1800218.1 OprO/OprP family phosphate-selective porin [Siccirubricoccus sp. G192]